MKNVAIIGAGLAGLTLANRLSSYAEVTLIEKSRGVGGRMATRKIDDYEFDHGVQFFTSHGQAFHKFLSYYMSSGDVREWRPHVITIAMGEKTYTHQWVERHYVGAPTMTNLCKKLAEGQNILFETHISRLAEGANGWQLQTQEQQIDSDFDWVISTAPAVQTCELIADYLPEELVFGVGGLKSVVIEPCFSLMLGFENLRSFPFDAAKVKNSAISWIILNSSKPGRKRSPALVIQTTNTWAKENLECSEEEIIETIFDELSLVLPLILPDPEVISLQRWRYSRVEKPLEKDYLLYPRAKLAACGDWAIEGRVEGAFTSAMKLGDELESLL